MQPLEIATQFSEVVYNSLPTVERAFAYLNDFTDFSDLLAQCAGALKDASDLDIGIFLLHKHHHLDPGEVMVERLEIDEIGPALVYSPVCLDSCAVQDGPIPSPCRWKIGASDDGVCLVPIEYSRDPNPLRFCRTIGGHCETLKALMEIVLRCNAADLLGFATVKRDLPLEHDQIYLEESDDARRRSIIRPASAKEARSAIPTIWSLDITLGCRSQARCNTRWSCNAWCVPGTNHRREHNQTSNHDIRWEHVNVPF